MIIIIKGFVPRCSLATEAKLLEMTWNLIIKIDYQKYIDLSPIQASRISSKLVCFFKLEAYCQTSKRKKETYLLSAQQNLNSNNNSNNDSHNDNDNDNNNNNNNNNKKNTNLLFSGRFTSFRVLVAHPRHSWAETQCEVDTKLRCRKAASCMSMGRWNWSFPQMGPPQSRSSEMEADVMGPKDTCPYKWLSWVK